VRSKNRKHIFTIVKTENIAIYNSCLMLSYFSALSYLAPPHKKMGRGKTRATLPVNDVVKTVPTKRRRKNADVKK
jgi:hypothetical protein